jgi:hypothetical protein
VRIGREDLASLVKSYFTALGTVRVASLMLGKVAIM